MRLSPFAGDYDRRKQSCGVDAGNSSSSRMSQLGQFRKSDSARIRSVDPSTADMLRPLRHVSFVPRLGHRRRVVLLYRRGSGRQRNGLSASGKKLRPFHKVPRERDIDTILMWVIEPSIPIKMCFRRTPPFVVMRPRRYLSLICWTPKYGPSSGEAEAED